MKKLIKTAIRKRRHKNYVETYIRDLRWEIINTVVSSSATGFHNGVDVHLESCGNLIRKYERRKRLLKF